LGANPELKSAEFAPAHNIHVLSGPFYACWQKGLWAWMEDWFPDALIVEANPRYLSTPLAVQWMKSRERPVIGWGLGAPPIHGPLAQLRNWRRGLFLKQFDALIAYSQRGAEEYRRLGFAGERVYVAANAVSEKPTGDPPRRPLGIDGQAKVLFVGRLQARKRLDTLLHALAKLPENLQPELTIVGNGPDRSALERLSEKIYPEAKFLGAQYGRALQREFEKADLFVLPGTGGLAVQQAMAFALPVIVAEGDGTQTDLVSSANGWLLPPANADALHHVLIEALSDAGRLRRLGLESYRLVKEKFNLEQMVKSFVQVLKEVGG
jgi:glycosyltransferase involved in cell wall biosynthesis